MKKAYLIILSILLSQIVFSQDLSKQQIIENFIEEIAENTDEELDYSTLFDDLYYLSENPINLNSATSEDLDKLQILTPYQIRNIVEYRKKEGEFLSIYELQLIKGLNKRMIFNILPFVTVEDVKEKDNIKLRNVLKYGSNQIFVRYVQTLEEQEGFSYISDSALAAKPNSRYLGGPQQIYTRYKYHYKDRIYWGFSTEKDPGEELFRGTQKNGFDYYSAHLQINDIGIIKKLNIGDYQVQFGQGLALWSGMGFGKSSYPLNIMKTPRGLKKYSSTNENLFMRGVGTTLQYKNLEFTTFVSKKKIDANISEFDSLENEVAEISSILNTGLHRTPGELEDKNAIDEFIVGGNLTYNHDLFKAGLTVAHYEYGADLNKASHEYNQFDFSGNANTNIGFNYLFTYKGINFFGEEAITQNLKTAFVNGAIFNIAPQMSMAILHRSYSKDYDALFAGGFAESKTQNEDGLYVGTEMFPIKRWKISAYYDMYKFDWLKSSTSAPSNGIDYFAQLDYDASRYIQMYVKFKQETKSKNLSVDYTTINPIQNYTNSKIRYHIVIKVSDNITLKNRIELSNYKEETEEAESGYMVYQDISYKANRLPLALSFRYAVFDTDTYNSRIYAYENDILYAFSIPAYYSKGIRSYLVLKYGVTNKIDVWLRYSLTRYTDKDVIGSALTEIQGNYKSQVKAQVRFKF